MGLPRANPSDLGVDATGIADLIDALRPYEPHGLIVVKSGHVVAEAQWAPYRNDEPTLVYSLSKGFTSAAAALAVADGLLTLDDRVLDHLPEYADRTVPELHDLRVRHTLTMSSGHARDLLDGPRDLSVDIVELLLTTVPENAPGTWFQYNQPATFTAAAIVQRLTGQRLLDYLRTRLFDAFGAAEPISWIADTRGHDLGFSGLRVGIETIACLGQLLLDDGTWDGERVFPDGWVADAARAHIDTPHEPEPDWRLGYGLQTWMGRHGYRHDGAFGQFCLVFPEQDAVVAITACSRRMQRELDEVYRNLLPALTSGTGGPDCDRALLDKTQHLEIELPALTEQRSAREYSVSTSHSWAPSTAVFDDGALRLLFDEHSDVGALDHQLECHADRWSEATLPTTAGPLRVRTRGGRCSDGTAYITLAVIDAPHRLILTEPDAADPKTLVLQWNQAPLHGIDPATMVAS